METLAHERRDATTERDAEPVRSRAVVVALLVSMRPGEWVKNVLVFAGLVFGKKLQDFGSVTDVLVVFISFCMIASAGYLFDDIRDAPLDRRHPDKSRRPIASGELQRTPAIVAATMLSTGAIALSTFGVSPEIGGLVALYGVVAFAYSLALKRLVILDVMTVSSLFILRVVAGAVAVGAHASPYLLVVTGMLALFLGFTKRRQEAMLETRNGLMATPVLEHYSIPFLDQLVSMVTSTAVVAYVIYAVNSPLIGSRMLITAPSVLYGVFRYLYLIYDREDPRSTTQILVGDAGIMFAVTSWIAMALIALYAVD